MNRIITYTFSLIPVFYIFYQSLFNDEIINPYSYLIISSGYIAMSMIIIILSVPLLYFVKNFIDRRSLGLITFVVTLFHFFLYLLDNSFNFKYITSDLISLWFIQAGYLALLLFIPLVLTSTDKLRNKLGNKWFTLHRLIYLILVLSLLHYYLIIKADYFLFNLYLAILLAILIIKRRVYSSWIEESSFNFY